MKRFVIDQTEGESIINFVVFHFESNPNHMLATILSISAGSALGSAGEPEGVHHRSRKGEQQPAPAGYARPRVRRHE